MSIHEGHRQRIKARFREEGLENFSQIHVLELLLCYCVPRKDVNPLAHALLERFGSLANVLEASTQELEKVDGVGENISTFLTLITAAGRYYQTSLSKPGEIVRDIERCGQIMLPYFYGRNTETVFLLCLDAKCKVICCREIERGTVNSAVISVRKVVEAALDANATSVVLAHNHPSGVALPSPEDVQTTHRLAKALYAVEITLLDHVIVADSDYVSIAQSGMYRIEDAMDK